MTRNSKLLLVVLISAAHLAICFVGNGPWLFGCLENTNHKQIISEVAQFNRSACGQTYAYIELLELTELRENTPESQRLQEYIDVSGQFDDCFVSVLDSESGRIICHPAVSGGDHLLGSTWDRFLVAPENGDFLQQIRDTVLDNENGVLMSNGSSFYLAHGKSVPELGIHIVSHRLLPESNSSMLGMLRGSFSPESSRWACW